jgi:hypothetical protein
MFRSFVLPTFSWCFRHGLWKLHCHLHTYASRRLPQPTCVVLVSKHTCQIWRNAARVLFLRNVSKIMPDYTASHPKRWVLFLLNLIYFSSRMLSCFVIKQNPHLRRNIVACVRACVGVWRCLWRTMIMSLNVIPTPHS